MGKNIQTKIFNIVFQNKLMMKISGPKGQHVRKKWRKLLNGELYDLLSLDMTVIVDIAIIISNYHNCRLLSSGSKRHVYW
jgi:hypothetical protein